MAKKKLNEAPPIDYGDNRERMSPDIEAKLRSQEHPLGGHQAFPDVDNDGIPDNFEELIASQRFQDVVQKVRIATSHLTGLDIAVMGCIVNGPGEMADADYGYVGKGPGVIALYRGREEISKVPEDEGVKALVDLIKGDGKWVDPN